MKSIEHSANGKLPKAPAEASATKRARKDQWGSGNMRGAFTRYLKQLDKQGEPSQKAFDELWDALRTALIYELKRCSLWASPPSFLGIYGWSSWWEKDEGPGRQTRALDELMNDLYSHVFLKRLPRLMAQLEVKRYIDGLVFLYIRNFVHDRRKAHDPLGFRVFENLRIAVRTVVASGELHVIGGDVKITSSTVLAFGSGTAGEEPVGAGVLHAIVESWNHDLIPDIMTASGAERQELVERLRTRLLGIEDEGVRVFRFRDLIGPMKRQTRSRWAAIFEREGGVSLGGEAEAIRSTAIRVAHPDERHEIRDSFRKLSGRITDRLERLEVPGKTRHYLRTLWTFLGKFACDDRMDTLPSNRKLATLLAIPRERLPGLYDMLREVVRHDGFCTHPLRIANEMGHSGLETAPGGFIANSPGASP